MFAPDVKRLVRLSGNALLAYITLGPWVFMNVWQGKLVPDFKRKSLRRSITKADTYMIVKLAMARRLFPDNTLERSARAAAIYAREDHMVDGLSFVEDNLFRPMYKYAKLRARFPSRRAFQDYIERIKAKLQRKDILTDRETKDLLSEMVYTDNVIMGGYSNIADFVRRSDAQELANERAILERDTKAVAHNKAEALKDHAVSIAALEAAKAHLKQAVLDRERTRLDFDTLKLAYDMQRSDIRDEAEAMTSAGNVDQERMKALRAHQLQAITNPEAVRIEQAAEQAERGLREAIAEVKAAEAAERAAQLRYEHALAQTAEVELLEFTAQDIIPLFAKTSTVQLAAKRRLEAAQKRTEARAAAEEAAQTAARAKAKWESLKRSNAAALPTDLSALRAGRAAAEHKAQDYELVDLFQEQAKRTAKRLETRRQSKKHDIDWDKVKDKVTLRSQLSVKRKANIKKYEEMVQARRKRVESIDKEIAEVRKVQNQYLDKAVLCEDEILALTSKKNREGKTVQERMEMDRKAYRLSDRRKIMLSNRTLLNRKLFALLHKKKEAENKTFDPTQYAETTYFGTKIEAKYDLTK